MSTTPGSAPRSQAADRLLQQAAGNPALTRLTDLAAGLLDVASVQVSLLTDMQVVAAATGLADGAVAAATPLADSLCSVTAAGRAPLTLPDTRADDRVAHLPPVVAGGVRSYLGVPLTDTAGIVIGVLCAFDEHPRDWSVEQVSLLEQLARSVMAELELSALTADYAISRQHWDVAIDAAGIGTFDWDLAGGRVNWDERLLRLFGYQPGESVPTADDAFRRVDEADLPGLDAAIAEAVETCGDYRAEFRVALPGGGRRWMATRGRVLAGADGKAVRVLGVGYDVTEAHEARAEAAQVLSTMAIGYLSLDTDWRVTYLNAAGERVVGRDAAGLLGGNLWEEFPGLAELEFGRQYRRAVATSTQVEFEAYYPHLDAWYDVRAVPTADGLRLYFLDITSRRAAQDRAAMATVRLELLAAVSAELGVTLDAEQAVARLSQLVVPVLADWCIVTLLDDEHGLRDIGWWHADPAQRPLVENYAAARLGALTDRSYVRRALRTGRPVLIPRDAGAAVAAVLEPGAARDLLDVLAPESAVFLPLRARGRTVGLLTMFRGPSRDALADGDLAVAHEVADRAGLALDNALLYAQQRSLAEGLQRSLLTEPPQPDNCEIAVRYVPAAEIASVGGDWFDAFRQADGATTVVIGDVVGHDTEAAAAMGQVRGLLRGIAWHSGAGPADVLSGLDAAMDGLLVDTTATAVVARIEQSAEERDRGVTRLRWSNAGHPPPMVLLPDGTVTVLAAADADLLLGIDPTTARAECEVVLDGGATLLLYTDGLVERRGQGLEEGLALLRDTLADLADRELDELCDGLLSRLLPDNSEDDVALVVVRLRRPGELRPAG